MEEAVDTIITDAIILTEVVEITDAVTVVAMVNVMQVDEAEDVDVHTILTKTTYSSQTMFWNQ